MRQYLNLKSILILNFAIAALAPLAVIGAVVVYLVTASTESEIRSERLVLGHAIGRIVEQHLDPAITALEQIDQVHRDTVMRPGSSDPYIDIIVGRTRGIDKVEILDTAGIVRHLAPYSIDGIGIDRSNQPYFAASLHDRRLHWSPVTHAPDGGNPSLTLSKSIDDGLIVEYLNIDDLNHVVGQVKLGQSGTAMIIDQEATIIAHTDRSVVRRQEKLSQASLRQLGPLDREGTREYIDNGITYFGTVIPIRYTGWALLVTQPSNETYAAVRNVTRAVIIGLIVAALIALAIARFSILRTLRPLHSLTQHARQIALGNYSTPPLAGGYQEIDALAQDFNTMAQAVLEREQRFRVVIEHAGDGFELIDQEGRYIDANSATLRQLGYTREELLQLSIFDVDPNLDRTRFKLKSQAISETAPLRIESLHRRKDGSMFPVEVSISCVQIGGIKHNVTFVRDITERKRVEAAVKESELKYRLLYETANDGIFLLDENGFLDCNQKGAQLYGLSKEDLIGRSPADLCPERQPDGRLSSEVVAEKNAAALRGEMPMFEWQFMRADGARFDVEITLNRLMIGGSTCLQAIVRDITERKHMEEARLRSQKLESLGTLAGGIAHDFNNILLAINGNASLALEDLAPEHPARPSLLEIAKAGNRASDLVRRILAFSRPKGEMQAAMQLQPVLEEAVKLLRATLPATIEFRHRYEPEVPWVAADATQVHEAVLNLATNAAHAIDGRPGIIEFDLEPADVTAALAARVPGLRPGRYARLSVKDNGCGMNEATVGRIFEAFFTTKPVGQGTGLGLSMVHGIMKAHGGAIGVDSAPGLGSTFALYFPAAETQDENTPADRAPAATRTDARRVLYLDDEEALVLLLGRVLGRAGHQVTGFTDPQAALGAFRERPQDYDIVVTDLSMPGMTGFDVAREVLSIRGDMPVLLTTGYLRPEDEQQARAVGIRQVILKPNTVDEMAQVLNRLFQHGKG